MIRAALLDAEGRFLRIDELRDEVELTDRHLPSITTCDLPAGQYVWVVDESAPAGGQFRPIRLIEEQADAAASALRVIARKRELLDEAEVRALRNKRTARGE